MRLHIGLVLGTIAVILVLVAIPASWYHVHVVGPNFMAIGVQDPGEEIEYRELEGELSLRRAVINNQTWEAPPERFEEPMTVMPIMDDQDPNVPVPNENAIEVVRSTTIAIGAAVVALALGGFGAWNIARFDRFRAFTAASFLLAGILVLGACIHFSGSINDAMAADAETELEDTFGLAFEPYLDPEEGTPGYYSYFSGEYPDNNPQNTEQLSYGPGAGFWLAGAGGILAIVTALVLVAAPQYHSLREKRPREVEVVRYVPVPAVTSLRERRLRR